MTVRSQSECLLIGAWMALVLGGCAATSGALRNRVTIESRIVIRHIGGTGPFFTVRISGDRRVAIDVPGGVTRGGPTKLQARLSPAELSEIVDAYERIRFFEMDESVQDCVVVTDAGESRATLDIGPIVRTIRYDWTCPRPEVVALRAVEARVMEILGIEDVDPGYVRRSRAEMEKLRASTDRGQTQPAAVARNAARSPEEIGVDPESRFGLMLGMPQEQLVGAMVEQGFFFAGNPDAQGRFQSLGFERDRTQFVASLLRVGRRAGAAHIWGSDSVLLGFRERRLVYIFDRPRPRNAFEESRDGFNWRRTAFMTSCGDPLRHHLPPELREATIGELFSESEAHWQCPAYSVELFQVRSEDPNEPHVAVVYYAPELLPRETAPRDTPPRQIRVDPESRFGLMVGMRTQNVIWNMREQGFSFTGYPVGGRKFWALDFQPDESCFFEAFVTVHRGQGAMQIWGSDSVVLGFRQGELAFIFDRLTPVTAIDEGRSAFEQRRSAFAAACGKPIPDELPARLREATIGDLDTLSEAHWNCPRYSVQLFEVKNSSGDDSKESEVVAVYYDPYQFPRQ